MSHSSSSETPPLIIYRCVPTIPNYIWSAFSNKLEAALRFASYPYTVGVGSMLEAPRGKTPYARYQVSADSKSAPSTSQVFCDSHAIIAHLVAEAKMVSMSEGLSTEQKAIEVALRALIEERLYFLQLYECWMPESHFYIMRDHSLSPLSVIPYPIRVVIGLVIFRRLKSTLYGQGVLRYTDAERSTMREECFDAVTALLEANRPPSKRISSKPPPGSTSLNPETSPKARTQTPGLAQPRIQPATSTSTSTSIPSEVPTVKASGKHDKGDVVSSALETAPEEDDEEEQGEETEELHPGWWLLGTCHPTEADASLYGLMTAMLTNPASGANNVALRARPVLMQWAVGVHRRYFADYLGWEKEKGIQ